MGRGCSLLLLLLLLPPGPRAAVSLLRYRYDCGDQGMQLLAHPPPGRTVRFKVLDEFGTRFDVANCSICLHWLNTGTDGTVIFSSGYEGCHVLVKEDRYVLRVQLEELLLSGVLVASYQVNMTCPQAADDEIVNTRTEHQPGRGTQLTREQCQVTVGRMACVAPPGREPCLQAGCCYDDMDRVAPCYYGNTATVQCLLDGHFVLVVPRGLVTQPYNLDSVRLASAQPGCQPLRVTDAFVMFRFAVTQCGTTVQVIEDQLVYENQLISTIDVQGSPRGSITRDSTYM
ncbi:hypothetical protein Q9966_013352 [Columba livia]|nr:hypothetical protein Q9966_013352 [Columba livia]